MPGVYISFPFCAQKCSFCNFASGVFPRELEGQYVAALEREISRHAWDWVPDTVYIGGGTPSRLAAEDLAAVLAAIPGKPWTEATIEAAPGSFSADDVRLWRDNGLNRVSLGVQSFVLPELQRTGRKHTPEIVEADVRVLRQAGISNINLDLIAGLPGQTRESWQASLEWIERLAPPHVSVYLFEIDEDSRLGLEVLNNGSRYGAAAVPDENTAADLYEAAVDRLANRGIERYEISNFAQPGSESLHNLKYWTQQPYIGFGADAHSFDGGLRWGNVESAAEYVARSHKGLDVRLDPTTANADEERFFVGLRLMRGVEPTSRDETRYAAVFDRLIDEGLLERNGSLIRLTRNGVLLSNEVFGEFLS
ncbi:MAG TPA: radical SAM family heme chaperone HemW [Bryobacteraceae bacterium]|nr:radical SAM family heme chaperone HemW [Bryobacteraceae bacterium]